MSSYFSFFFFLFNHIYFNKCLGSLLNFWILRVDAYSRLGAYSILNISASSKFILQQKVNYNKHEDVHIQ